ncbi:MAG TPA: hypothetical protein VGC60_16010 [Pyrinomonadaceae bacterium]|jgi:hypothetical protein
MDIRKFFLGTDEFKSPEEIIELIRTSDQFDAPQEDTAGAEALLIFQTSKQQTWLVATRARLYCVLDDLNKSFTRVQWTTPADKLVAGDQIAVEISTSDKTERTGRLNIGERRNWLFSKKLFPTEGPEARVKEMITRQMTAAVA